MRVLLHGAKGVMGQNVQEVAKQTEGMEIVAGLDSHTDLNHPGFPVYGSGGEVKEEFDCIIDFSVKEAVDALLDFAVKKKKPLVLCTTGLNEAQEKKLQEASKQIPILRSGNMSLGINLLQELLRIAAKKLYENGFDIEIMEAHHRRKKDAPSGTALMLEKAVEEGIGESLEMVYDRSCRDTAREKREIGMSSLRGGTIPGIHEVIFAGEDEVISLNHTAYSRKIFAKGAITAAFFLEKQEPGSYSMADVLK